MRYLGGLIGMLVGLTAAVGQTPISDYIWRTEEVLPGSGPAASELRAELEAHLLEMIDTGNPAIDSGLLQPALYRTGLAGEFLVYGSPAETLLFLSDLYPVLSPAAQNALRVYLNTLLNEFPPLERSFVHGDGFWGETPMERNRREFYPMPPTLVNLWPPPEIPLETLYALWRYADATGDWEYVRQRLGALQALYATYVPPANRFGQILGLIGAARIAEHEGLRGWRDAAVSAAVTAINGADYVAWANIAQQNFTRWHDWCYPIFHFMRAETAVGVAFGPELGRLLRDRWQGAVTAHAGIQMGGPGPHDHARWCRPTWMSPRGQFSEEGYMYMRGVVPGWGSTYEGGENSYYTPDFSWTFFLLRAWVYEEPAELLRIWIDAPMCIGDLCHMHKIATAWRAYGTRTWRSVRGGNLDNDVDVDQADLALWIPCMEGPERVVPDSCRGADLNGDADVDLHDWARMQLHATGPRS